MFSFGKHWCRFVRKIAAYLIKAFDEVRNQILSVLEMHRRPRVFEMPPLQYPVKRTSRVPVSMDEGPCRLLEVQGMSVCTFLNSIP